MKIELSAPAEDCLLLVHRMTERQEEPSTSSIAKSLGVTDSTITAMVQKLAKLKLLEHEPRKSIALTESGKHLTLKLIRRHRLIETFLLKELGYGWEEIHAEAERIEHVVSDRFVEAIDKQLGYPTHDPHGDPIPNANGQEVKRVLTRLSEAKLGQTGKFARVQQKDGKILSYLNELGMQLGSKIEVLEIPQFDSVIKLKVNGRECVIGQQLAAMIFIEE